MVLFAAGCAISYFANGFVTLISGQMVQGLGLGAPRVLGLTIARDKFEGNQMARTMSLVMAVFVFTPVISPSVGKFFVDEYGWRMLFILFSILAAFVFVAFQFTIPESLKTENRRSFNFREIRHALVEILSNKSSMGFVLILGLYSGVFIAYLNLSQPILQQHFQLNEAYPMYFAFLASSIGVASILNAFLVKKVGSLRLVLASLFVAAISTIPILFISRFFGGQPPLAVFLVLMYIQLFSYGILIGNLSSLALQPMGHIAGLGSAVVGALSTIISVPLSVLVGSQYNQTISPLVIGFMCCGFLSLAIYSFINKKSVYYGKVCNQ